MAEPLHEPLHEAYDVDVAKLNRLAAKSAERAEKLKAENEKLREQLSESRQANERMYIEIKRYKNVLRTRPISMNALFDENTKLRELVIGIWPFAKKTYQSTRRIRDGKVVVFDACEIMRDLGIEVG